MSVATNHIGFRNLAIVSSLLNCIGEVMLDGLITEFGNKLKKECKIRDKYYPVSDDTKSASTTSKETESLTKSLLDSDSESLLFSSVDANADADAEPEAEDSDSELASDDSSISDAEAERLFAEQLSVSLPQFLTRANARAVVQSECMTVRSAASVFAALLSMFVMWFTDKARVVIFATTFIPAIIFFAAFFFPEKRLPSNSHLRYNCCSKLLKDYEDSENEALAAAANANANANVGLHRDSALTSYSETSVFASLNSSSGSNSGVSGDEHVNEPSSASDSTLTTSKETRSFARILAGAVWLRMKLIFRAIVVLIRPVLFVFIVNTMPKYSTPWYSFMYSEYTFPGWVFSAFTLISLSGAFLGSILYLRIFSRIALDKVFFISNVLDVVATIPLVFAAARLNTAWFGIPDVVYIPVISFIDAVFGRIALMPSLVLAAESCPPQLGLESTMFSLFTSVSYAASLSSYAIQVALTRHFNLDGKDFSELPSFVGVCLACQLIPLLCVQILPTNDHDGLETEEEATAHAAEVEIGKEQLRSIAKAAKKAKKVQLEKNQGALLSASESFPDSRGLPGGITRRSKLAVPTSNSSNNASFVSM